MSLIFLSVEKSTSPSFASTLAAQEVSAVTTSPKSLSLILDLNDLARRDDHLGSYFSQKMKADPLLGSLSSIDQIAST
ncbi:MAG: hypothetical protein KTR16_15750 [Acidiferrobacterales bacterium]|nr:hypothetical protein [Acidiferrobacterales bacterium]